MSDIDLPPPESNPVTVTGIDIPTRDILVFLLRLNAAQLFLMLVFGLPVYWIVRMTGAP